MAVIMPVTWMISCSGKPGKVSEKTENIVPVTNEEVPTAKLIKLLSPEENAELKLNETVKVVIGTEGKNGVPDSVKIWFDSKPAGVIKSAPWEFTVNQSYTIKTGRKALKVVAYGKGKSPQTITRFLIV